MCTDNFRWKEKHVSKHRCYVNKFTGERGDYGYFGPVGEKGDASFSGKYQAHLNYIISRESAKRIRFIQGVQGEMGNPGQTGPHGYHGRPGSRGPKGEEGEAGLGNFFSMFILEKSA